MPELPLNEARLLILRTLWLDWQNGWRGVKEAELFHAGAPLAEIALLAEAGLIRRKAGRLSITAQGVAFIETFDKEYCHA